MLIHTASDAELLEKAVGDDASAYGDLVQVDTLDVWPLPDVVFEQITARDMVSRWDVLRIGDLIRWKSAILRADGSSNFANELVSRKLAPFSWDQVFPWDGSLNMDHIMGSPLAARP